MNFDKLKQILKKDYYQGIDGDEDYVKIPWGELKKAIHLAEKPQPPDVVPPPIPEGAPIRHY